jgi:hypothetical protein
LQNSAVLLLPRAALTATPTGMPLLAVQRAPASPPSPPSLLSTSRPALRAQHQVTSRGCANLPVNMATAPLEPACVPKWVPPESNPRPQASRDILLLVKDPVTLVSAASLVTTDTVHLKPVARWRCPSLSRQSRLSYRLHARQAPARAIWRDFARTPATTASAPSTRAPAQVLAPSTSPLRATPPSPRSTKAMATTPACANLPVSAATALMPALVQKAKFCPARTTTTAPIVRKKTPRTPAIPVFTSHRGKLSRQPQISRSSACPCTPCKFSWTHSTPPCRTTRTSTTATTKSSATTLNTFARWYQSLSIR